MEDPLALASSNLPCALCGAPLGDGELAGFSPFVMNRADPLYVFHDAAMHLDCLKRHPLGIQAEGEHTSGQAGRSRCRVCREPFTSHSGDVFVAGLLTSDKTSPAYAFNHVVLHRSHFQDWTEAAAFRSVMTAFTSSEGWDGPKLVFDPAPRWEQVDLPGTRSREVSLRTDDAGRPIRDDPSSFDLCGEVLGGRRVKLDGGARKVLSFLLGEGGRDAVVSRRGVSIQWPKQRKPYNYFANTAPGMLDWLLEAGDMRPFTESACAAIGPGSVTDSPERLNGNARTSSPWSFGPRHVWVEAGEAEIRIAVRDADSGAALPTQPSELEPWAPQIEFIELERAVPCPACGKPSTRYRAAATERAVCQECGCSSSRSELEDVG